MGAGESIENHRMNEVIDHPQSSIVGDKFNAFQDIFQNYFIASSSYLYNGSVDQTGKGYISVLSSTAYHTSDISLAYPGIDTPALGTADILIDFSLYNIKSSSPIFTSKISFGGSTNCFGVEFTNAQWRIFYCVEGDYIYSSWFTSNIFGLKRWRFYLDSASHALILFLDGVQVASISSVATESWSDNIIFISTIWTSGGFHQMLISQFRSYIDYKTYTVY